MFKKALVPFDGSEIAAAALDCAAQAVAPDAKIVLVQVIDSAERIIVQTTPAGFEFSSGFDPNLVDSILRAQRSAASEHLEQGRSRLASAGMTDIETRVLEGLPGDEIVRLASEEGFDVVVMGTHGRSGLARGVLGSVADHVVRHLEGIPVLLINPPEE